MKHKLPCELVRDLLPSYVDELTSNVTNELVEEHVADCAECQEVLDVMRGPEMNPAIEEEEKEIDFLKKTRRRTRWIVLGSIVAAFAIFLTLLFVRVCFIGDVVGSETAYCQASVQGNVLTMEVTMMDSARAPVDIRFEEEEAGVINVSCRAALAGPWNNVGVMSSEYTSKAVEIRQVKVDNRIIWADGEDILAITSAVYATRHPYVGDMPANALPVAALNMGSYLGGFSNELQTGEEPYGWSFVLADEVPAERVALKERMMKSYAYVLLAVVENLGEVSFEYSADGENRKFTVTTEEASVYAGYDIKLCYENIVLLQKLIQKTGLDGYAFMDTDEIEMIMEAATAEEERQTAEEARQREEEARQREEEARQMQEVTMIDSGEIQIKIVNNADDDVFMMGLSYSLDGDLKGSQYGGYAADDTMIRRGDSMTFTFYPQDFELSDWNAESYAEIKAEIEDKNGNNYPVDPAFSVPVRGGAVYTYILSGNAKDGYVIGQ